MEKKLVLGTDEFNYFLRCLGNLRDVCNDADIQNGILRQRSNDMTIIYEMDMKEILQDVSLPISDIKRKIDLLKVFSGSSEITIDIRQDKDESKSFYIIGDDVTQIKFVFPARDFLDNTFVPEEELNNIFLFQDENLILDDDLQSLVAERIRVISDNFNVVSVQIRIQEDGQAKITAATQASDQFATLKDDITANMTFEEEVFINLSTIQFNLDCDGGFNLKVYKDPKENITLNKLSTELGSVKINVYSRSMLNSDS